MSQASEALKSLLKALQERSGSKRELDKLHLESQKCGKRKQRLEEELFKRRFEQLKGEKEQGMLQESFRMLESMSCFEEVSCSLEC